MILNRGCGYAANLYIAGKCGLNCGCNAVAKTSKSTIIAV